MNIIQQFIVFLFALLAALVGDLVVSYLMNKLRAKDGLPLVAASTRWLGYVERFLYVIVWFANQPQFIGIWLGIKALGEWSFYKADEKNGRGHYTVFLVGTGSSLIVALLSIGLGISFIESKIELQINMDLKELSEIFYNVTVGTGAILAGGAGFVAFREYIASSKNKARINSYKIRYNRENFLRGDFSLVHSPIVGQEDRIYILEEASKRKYWIVNPKTLNDMGFQFSDAEKSDLKRFESFLENDPINFY